MVNIIEIYSPWIHCNCSYIVIQCAMKCFAEQLLRFRGYTQVAHNKEPHPTDTGWFRIRAILIK